MAGLCPALQAALQSSKGAMPGMYKSSNLSTLFRFLRNSPEHADEVLSVLRIQPKSELTPDLEELVLDMISTDMQRRQALLARCELLL